MPVPSGTQVPPTATHAVTPTAPPAASPTATYALTPAAMIRLEDAAARVTERLDPLHAPRVEDAFYLTEADVWSVAPGRGNYGRFVPDHMETNAIFPISDSVRLLAVVVASTAGMDLLHTAGQHAGQGPSSGNTNREWPSICSPVPANRRQGIVTKFHASSGHEVGTGLISDVEDQHVLGELAALGRRVFPLATPLATDTVEATTTPTATPTINLRPPERREPDFAPRELAIGEVPAALAEAVAELPLVRGSNWHYRRTSHRNGVEWRHHDYTVTVAAAWQVAPDATVVRVYDGGATGMGPREADPDQGGVYDLLILPTGVFSDFRLESLDGMRASLATPLPPPEDEGWPTFADGRPERLRLPLRVWTTQRIGRVGVLEREDVVTVPAGRFPHCFESRTVLSAGNSVAKWICRGVGLVRRDTPRCSTFYGGHDADELLRYSVPVLGVRVQRRMAPGVPRPPG